MSAVPDIEGAAAALADAERELETALRAVVVVPGAEKVAISAVLESAFAKVRLARVRLKAVQVPDED